MKRNLVLDYAKGMVIVLMVVGHCYSKENFLLNLIYGFHMPFFFIISGMIYGNKAINENYRFSYKKAGTGLMVPYFFYETVFAVFLAAIAFLSHSETLIPDFLNRMKQMIALKGITVTWYLACIAMVETVFMFLYSRSRMFTWILTAVFSIGGIIAAPYVLGGGTTVLTRCAIGIGFFGIGFAVGRYRLLSDCRCISSKFVLPVALAVYVLLVRTNGMVSIVSLKIGNPLLYVTNGLLGTGIVLIISEMINRMTGAVRLKDILTRLGQNTLFILGIHMVLIEFIRMVDYQLFRNLLPKFGIGEGIIFGAIICATVYLMIPLYRAAKMRIKK